ncbi:MAG: hypothetical protein AB7E21_17635 [Pseudodonghicola sp.]
MALNLFLHGASSSGKSTLARQLRLRARRPFLHLSINHLRDSGTWIPAAYPDWRAARSGFFSGFHRVLARLQAPLPRSAFFAAPKAP